MSAAAATSRPPSSSSRTLSLLNVGQGAIISIGLVAVMVMAGYGVMAGTMTLGDFVAVNAFLIQLYMPLNMLGFAYREIRNALVNMESMFGLLDVPAEIADKPGAPALKVSGRRDRVRPCRLPLREGAADPARRQLPRGAGRHGGDRGLERRRQVDGLAHPVPLLRRRRGQRPDRRPGHPRRHPVEPARGDRRGAAGHRAVQRHDLLQHRLRPARRHARGGRAGGAARAHPRLHHGPAAGLRDDGGRARPEAVGRREAARGDRPHHPEEPAASCCSTRRPARSTRAPSRRSSARWKR